MRPVQDGRGGFSAGPPVGYQSLLRRLIRCPATGRPTDTGFELSRLVAVSGGGRSSWIAWNAVRITSGDPEIRSSVDAGTIDRGLPATDGWLARSVSVH